VDQVLWTMSKTSEQDKGPSSHEQMPESSVQISLGQTADWPTGCGVGGRTATEKTGSVHYFSVFFDHVI